jgi:WD40 repeat protein
VNTSRLAVHWQDNGNDCVSALSWNPEGRFIAVAYANGELLSYDHLTAKRRLMHPSSAGITQLAQNPRNNILAIADEHGQISLVDPLDENGAETVLQARGKHWIDRLQWSADGTILAAATSNAVTLYSDRKPYAHWESGDAIGDIAWSATGRKIAVAANHGLYLWLDGQRSPQKLLSFPGAGISCAWHRSGQAIAVGTQDSQLYFWLRQGSHSNAKAKNKAKQLSMRGYPSKVNLVDWHPKKLIAATAGGNDIVLWQLKSAKNKSGASTLEQHDRPLTSLAYNPSGALLASADRDGQICFWRDNVCEERFDANSEITCLAWNPNGDSLVAGNQQGQTLLLELSKKMLT